MFGRDMGSLEVVLSDRQTVLRRHGNQGDAWHPAIINANLTSGDKVSYALIKLATSWLVFHVVHHQSPPPLFLLVVIKFNPSMNK